mmetsp:Transcript_4384/g.27934  ORF Transcript_4384/g.27934 Transcript_4384/m.27934 type:complete len:143 (-) Transcript_4384:3014-3442(-)
MAFQPHANGTSEKEPLAVADDPRNGSRAPPFSRVPRTVRRYGSFDPSQKEPGTASAAGRSERGKHDPSIRHVQEKRGRRWDFLGRSETLASFLGHGRDRRVSCAVHVAEVRAKDHDTRQMKVWKEMLGRFHGSWCFEERRKG